MNGAVAEGERSSVGEIRHDANMETTGAYDKGT
jgi:hypothetical protein